MARRDETVGDHLAGRIGAGDLPGASWAVWGPDGELEAGAAGDAVVVPEHVPASAGTIYDLASLTKPLVTSLLCLRLRKELDLGPDEPAWRFLPELDRLDRREIRLRHLLTHTSGLPPWLPLYLRGRSVKEYLLQLRETPLEARPGERVSYSDCGYILLGEILERCASQRLDRLAAGLIFEPLKLESTTFNPPPAWRPRVAATEDSCQYERELAGAQAASYRGFREGIIRGEVHDQNAWAAGGVAGHAGLFSTAREVSMIAREFLGGPGGARGLLDEESIRLAQIDQIPALAESRSFAFRVALRGETAAGPDLPAGAFGHNGFTGTSVWLDPGRMRVYVLLTNRVHPRVSDSLDMTALRRRFHSLAARH